MQSKKWQLSRRGFLLKFTQGTGVMLGLTAVGCAPIRRVAATKINEIDSVYKNKKRDTPMVWFEITPDNLVILKSPKVEMGQGIFTGFSQIVADELDVTLEQIKVVHATTEDGPVDKSATGGSSSTSGLWNLLRELSATLREMIKNNAATILNVPVETLVTKNGTVGNGTITMTYGEVVAQSTDWKIPRKTPALKSPKEYQYIGKEVSRVDLKPKVVGAPIYGMDASLPNMLYGSVVRASMVDATYIGADTTAAEQMPGVIKVVKEKDFVGVVATSKMAVELAKRAIQAKWKVNKIWQQAEIEEMIKVGNGKAVVIQKEGKVKKLLRGAKVIRAEYTSPIGAHAQLEPNGALADFQNGKVTVYISTQVVKITQEEIADRLKLKNSEVTIVPTFLGGGFGRRLHTPNAVQAALLSKAVGRPVHCFFNRQEEFQNDTFRPPTHHVLQATLNEDGKIAAMEHHVSSGAVAFGSALMPKIAQPILGADLGAWRGGMIQYSGIPNYRAISSMVDLPFATSWWRSLGLLANTFAIETFMDELAYRAKQDPIEFRLAQIKNDEQGHRLKEVIKAARYESGWGKKLAEGRAMGFACSTDTNTPVAQVVEISLEEDASRPKFKRIKVHQVTCTIDVGIAINPDGIRAQCEGAIIMGMSAALFEEMKIKDGKIRPTLYGAYDMVLMKDAPKEIKVVILENHTRPTGVGEPPLGPIGAAIGNAVFKLTGERLRGMPLRVEV